MNIALHSEQYISKVTTNLFTLFKLLLCHIEVVVNVEALYKLGYGVLIGARLLLARKEEYTPTYNMYTGRPENLPKKPKYSTQVISP